jgi:signal transduction histidine kinase
MSFLFRFFDLFLPASLRNNPTDLMRGYITVGMIFTNIFFCLLVLVELLFVLELEENKLIGVALNSACLVGYLIALLLLIRTENYVLCANFLISTLAVVVIIGIQITGGFLESPISPLVLQLPVTAFLLMGLRRGIIWLAIALLICAVAYLSAVLDYGYVQLLQSRALIEAMAISLQFILIIMVGGALIIYESINSLLTRMLQEQSHQAGVAELASGVLHNIGNAITPLKVHVANLESALRAAPLPELNMALAELEEAGTTNERRTDLREFLDLGTRELSALMKNTIDQIVSMAHQVEHVQKILSDQESISRLTRIMQPVKVTELVGESVELLGTEIPRTLRVDMDASLTSVGQVLGSPVALQQIVINLLKNAAESIKAHTPVAYNGRIGVAAIEESRDGRAMIGLSINDNGAGISQENLSRVFQRGFSTKSRRTSGQGLHWCAITAAAFGGKITIDSDGTGQGATVSLWLPKA